MIEQNVKSTSDKDARDWLDKLVTKAIDSRASDIHIEPSRDYGAIRLRVDGFLYELERFEKQYYDQMISQIKVVSQLDITKHKLPQDGHFEVNNNGEVYNLRVSTYPTIYGEVAVLRVLNRDDSLLGLKELGLDEDQYKDVIDLIYNPYGIILITGPSGSGKTTFLNSILTLLNKPDNNIITIEDPVELKMEGIRQTQINQYEEFNFSTALRAVLRQDPDIMMVGEIRDSETAQISIQAALTGKLIFSTFHTLDVFGIISRMLEMEIPRSVLAHTISGVISTRLVRKICNECKVKYELTEDEKSILSGVDLEGIDFHRGEGCDNCAGSGYYGRIGIFEVIKFGNDIRAMIVDNLPYVEMLEVLERTRRKTLRESAIDIVYQGITTMEEVIRVVGKPVVSINHK